MIEFLNTPEKKWMAGLILGLISITTPIHPILWTIALLVIFDTIFGVWASLKTGAKLTSNRAGRVVSKLFIYESVVIVLFFVELNVWGAWLPAVKLASCSICFVEVLSLLENAGKILGQPVFKYLINKIGSKGLK